MDLLAHLFVLVLAFALVHWIIQLIPLPASPPFKQILLIIMCLFALGVLAGEFGLWGSWGVLRHR
jgi:hypothetical protein